MSIASWISPPASALTFPISRVIRSERLGFSRSRSCANRKRMLPRSGDGTRRESSAAAFVVWTARSTSAAVERVNCSSTSPVEGFSESKVAVAMTAIVALEAGLLPWDVGVREGPRSTSAAAVADLALLFELNIGRAVTPVGAVAPVNDHRHVRVVLVVLDHLLEEVALELLGDHAIDRALSVRTLSARASPNQRRAISGTTRPSSSMCAFHVVNDVSSSDGSCPRPSRRTGLSDSGETRYWYQEMPQATVTTTSELTPERTTTETFGVPSDRPMPPTVRRYCDALKRSAAPIIACSWSERRR